MAKQSWQRPGSPIGRKGPRNADAKYQRRTGEPWERSEIRELRALAKQDTATGVMSLILERPRAAIYSKAHREGISLRPTNRSPYSRRSA